MSASARVVRIGASLRARTMARATARAWRSSPSVAMIVGEVALGGRAPPRRRRSVLRRPCACRADRRGGRRSRARPHRAASTRRRDRARRRRPRSWPHVCATRIELGEAVLDQREPAAGCSAQTGAARDRALVAIDRRSRAHRPPRGSPAIAAGAEGRVDIDAAVAHVEELDRGGGRARECDEPVRQRQQVLLSLPAIIPVLRADLPPRPGSQAAS